MRALFAIVLCVLLVSPILAGDVSIVVSTLTSDPIVLDEGSDVVTIVFPEGSSSTEVRIFDADGVEVPGEVGLTGLGERVFLPEVQPIPPGQYSFDIPALDLTRSFSVGPDEYAPKLRIPDPGPVERDGPIVLEFNESIKPSNVTWETVQVWETSGETPRRVPGTLVLTESGTRVTFTPVGWPGLTPEATFEVRIKDGSVTDLSGNAYSGETPVFQGAGERLTRDVRIPEGVFWSTRREVGVIDLRGDVPVALRARPVGDPTEMVIDPRVDIRGEGVAYGLNPRDDRLLVLDPVDSMVRDSAEVRSPSGIAVHPGGRFVYVASKKRGTVEVFDTSKRLEYLGSRKVGKGAAGVAASPDGEYVACLSMKKRRVTIMDAVTLEVLGVVETGPRPEDAAFVERGEDGYLLLVSCRGRRARDGRVDAIDIESGETVASLRGFSRPRRIVARDGRAWVAEEGADRVTEIVVPEAGAPTIGARIPAGRKPVDVATAPLGFEGLFVVSRRKSTVTVVDPRSSEIVTTIEVRGVLAVASWGEN